MRKAIIGAIGAAALLGGLVTADITAQYQVSAQRHSCGYHCNPDGSGVTPAAPPTTTAQIRPAGRTNVHSGGRTGGAANPRVGCGGCSGHPQSNMIGNAAGWQLI